MFGLFKSRIAPVEPVEIVAKVEIDRPAQEVYPLVDFGDPRHHKAAVGTITRTGDSTYAMVLDMLPDLTFPILCLDARPGQLYEIESVLPEELGARLCKTVECTEIEPTGENSCMVTLTTTGHFHPMKETFVEAEVAMLAMGCNNALAKLKIHAEQGVDAIREIEAQQAA